MNGKRPVRGTKDEYHRGAVARSHRCRLLLGSVAGLGAVCYDDVVARWDRRNHERPVRCGSALGNGISQFVNGNVLCRTDGRRRTLVPVGRLYRFGFRRQIDADLDITDERAARFSGDGPGNSARLSLLDGEVNLNGRPATVSVFAFGMVNLVSYAYDRQRVLAGLQPLHHVRAIFLAAYGVSEAALGGDDNWFRVGNRLGALADSYYASLEGRRACPALEVVEQVTAVVVAMHRRADAVASVEVLKPEGKVRHMCPCERLCIRRAGGSAAEVAVAVQLHIPDRHDAVGANRSAAAPTEMVCSVLVQNASRRNHLEWIAVRVHPVTDDGHVTCAGAHPGIPGHRTVRVIVTLRGEPITAGHIGHVVGAQMIGQEVVVGAAAHRKSPRDVLSGYEQPPALVQELAELGLDGGIHDRAVSYPHVAGMRCGPDHSAVGHQHLARRLNRRRIRQRVFRRQLVFDGRQVVPQHCVWNRPAAEDPPHVVVAFHIERRTDNVAPELEGDRIVNRPADDAVEVNGPLKPEQVSRIAAVVALHGELRRPVVVDARQVDEGLALTIVINEQNAVVGIERNGAEAIDIIVGHRVADEIRYGDINDIVARHPQGRICAGEDPVTCRLIGSHAVIQQLDSADYGTVALESLGSDAVGAGLELNERPVVKLDVRVLEEGSDCGYPGVLVVHGHRHGDVAAGHRVALVHPRQRILTAWSSD